MDILKLDESVLQKLQKIELDMLIVIDGICKREKIKYWLEGGSLLGAVRHKGFIPWDDDIDIGFTRNDYNRFINAFNSSPLDSYFVQDYKSDPYYGLPFAKFAKKNTTYSEFLHRNVKSHDYISIDLIPYDTYPKKKIQRFIQKYQVWILRGMILSKTHYDLSTGRSLWKKIISFPFKFFSLFLTKRFLIKNFEKKITKFDNEETGKLFNIARQYGSLVIEKRWIDNINYMDFEGEKFPCSVFFDEWLKKWYGDYIQLPPVSERSKGHQAYLIDFEYEK